jgi:FkbM family methyltransferase
MNFFDVGANVGVYSLLAAAVVGETGSVHAFEPTPAMANGLRNNIALNGCRSVVVNECALSSASGELSFNLHDEPGYNSLFVRQEEYATTQAVKAITLDAYVAACGVMPDAMKIDCEGAELEVIRGGATVFSRPDAPVLIIELNAETLAGAGATVDDLLAQLREFGYECFDVGTFTPGSHCVHNAVACKRAALERMPALRTWCADASYASAWVEPRR